jgi:hypothetical protein
MTALAHTGTTADTSAAKNAKHITLVSLAAVALLIGVTATLAYSQAASTQASELRGEAVKQLGAQSASRKVQCIMPAAWRQACGE